MTEQITLAQAAARYGLAAVSLRQAVHRGRLRAERVGIGQRAVWLTTPADVESYLASRPERFKRRQNVA